LGFTSSPGHRGRSPGRPRRRQQYVYSLGLLAQVSAAETYYYLADGLGSTRKTVDSSGVVVNEYASVTFGPGQSITTGWSCGLQGELPLVGGVGPVGQVGVAGLNEKKREEFREVGVGIVSPPRLGGSLSCYYVGEDLLP
jgi:hypothetical protein